MSDTVDLVLEGGGVKGIGLVGAISVLEEHGMTFARVAGASAGAIVGSLVAAGMCGSDLQALMTSLDYTRFRDDTKLDHLPVVGKGLSLWLDHGIYAGDYFHGWIRDQLSGLGVDTFHDLYQADPGSSLPANEQYKLVVMTSDVSRGRLLRLPWDYISDDIEAALSDLAKLEERVHEGARTNDAKKMALELQGRIPFAYGAGVMGVMARRVKGQWNENAKNWSAFDVMSELNHNAVVGFEHPPIAKEALTVLLLRSDRDNPRHKLRFEVTRELLDRARIPHKTLQFAGRNMLSEVLQMVLFTDYVSFYIALLNGADPSPVKSIDYLKDRLAKGS